MATEYPTTVRIEPEIETDISTPVLVLTYGTLWVAFTLGGVLAAVTMAEFVGGLAGTALLVTVGLGFVAAGPVAARRVMESLLDRVQ